jgi:hypothetical protein
MGLICGNCNASLGCGCQVRRAKDGKSCCDKCIAGYELYLNTPRNEQSFIPNGNTPVILNISSPDGTIKYNNLNT